MVGYVSFKVIKNITENIADTLCINNEKSTHSRLSFVSVFWITELVKALLNSQTRR